MNIAYGLYVTTTYGRFTYQNLSESLRDTIMIGPAIELHVNTYRYEYYYSTVLKVRPYMYRTS